MLTASLPVFSIPEPDRRGMHPYFPAPETAGIVGGITRGSIGLFGNHMSTLLPENGGIRVYLTRRIWRSRTETEMDIGFVDAAAPAEWPDLNHAYRRLEIEGLPAGCSAAQPVVLKKDGGYELFFWIHGAGMIRYVKCAGDDGIHFRILNLDEPCLFHPSDRAVRTGSAADGLLSIRSHLTGTSIRPGRTVHNISNDATNVFYDPETGLYRMFSVSLLPAGSAPERRVAHDNASGWLRVIHRRTSRDGIYWSDAELVLVPDQNDPADLQFYTLSQTGGDHSLIGVAGYYRAGMQIMEPMPVCSADGGRTMIRPELPWGLADGLSGQMEEPVRMLFPGGMLKQDNSIFWTATAFNFFHNQSGKLDPSAYIQQSVVFRSGADRWCGMVPDGKTGSVTTPPMQGNRWELVADHPETVRVSLLSVFGTVLRSNGRCGNDGAVLFPEGDVPNGWYRLKLDISSYPVYTIKSYTERNE